MKNFIRAGLLLISFSAFADGGGNTIYYNRISEDDGVITVYGPSVEVDGNYYSLKPSKNSAQGVCVAIGARSEAGSLDRPFFWRLPFTERTVAQIDRNNTRKSLSQGTQYMIQVYCRH